MCEFIKIEELAANAMIELDSKEISLEKLEKYGNAVVGELREQGKTAVLLMSRDYISMVSKKSDFFSVEDSTIRIRTDREVHQLKEKIRYTMTVELIKAYTGKNPLNVLQTDG